MRPTDNIVIALTLLNELRESLRHGASFDGTGEAVAVDAAIKILEDALRPSPAIFLQGEKNNEQEAL